MLAVFVHICIVIFYGIRRTNLCIQLFINTIFYLAQLLRLLLSMVAVSVTDAVTDFDVVISIHM